MQLTLAAEVARTYFELRGAQRQLAVALRNADVQRKTRRADAGSSGRPGVARRSTSSARGPFCNSRWPRCRGSIADRDADAIASPYCSGVAPEAVPAELLADGPTPLLPDSVTIGSPREVVRRRPDVLAAERQLAAQSLSVGASQAEYLPRFSLAASAGYTANRFESLTRTGTSRVVVRSGRELSAARPRPRPAARRVRAGARGRSASAIHVDRAARRRRDRERHGRRMIARTNGVGILTEAVDVEHARRRSGAAAFRGRAHGLSSGARRAAHAARRGESVGERAHVRRQRRSSRCTRRPVAPGQIHRTINERLLDHLMNRSLSRSPSSADRDNRPSRGAGADELTQDRRPTLRRRRRCTRCLATTSNTTAVNVPAALRPVHASRGSRARRDRRIGRIRGARASAGAVADRVSGSSARRSTRRDRRSA